jgi:hypothetical protein
MFKLILSFNSAKDGPKPAEKGGGLGVGLATPPWKTFLATETPTGDVDTSALGRVILSFSYSARFQPHVHRMR